ncbi:hypothetical protein EVAR_32922_1 [Eumeta japonica]|uniref:Uncharacterized protein n=1 Tax=Eumeta variegata TaxID=151549 RepID=A0A4C1X2Q7_EUMVA|nr:hypothetical protein EVAR_32922_1 [Eumeta japonica]
MRQCSLDRSVTDQHHRVHCTDSELFSGRIFCRCRYAPRMARDVAKPMRAGNKTVTIRFNRAQVPPLRCKIIDPVKWMTRN